MKISMKYFSIIGILLFIFLISKIDIRKVAEILLSANPFYILLALGFFGISLYIRALKWKLLVNFFNKDYSGWQALKTYVIGVAFGSVTPARTGDLMKVLDLKKETDMGIKQGISLTIFDKIIDIIILFGTALICSIIITYIFSAGIDIKWLVVVLIFFLVGMVFLLTRYAKNYLRPLFKIFVPNVLKEKIRDTYYTFASIVETISKDKKFVTYIFLTAISWLSLFFIAYLFAKSINLKVSPLYFLLFMPIVFGVEVLPITLLGIGSRDAALILLFSLINISKEAMVSISLMMLIFTNLPILITGLFIAWKNKYTINLELKLFKQSITK